MRSTLLKLAFYVVELLLALLLSCLSVLIAPFNLLAVVFEAAFTFSLVSLDVLLYTLPTCDFFFLSCFLAFCFSFVRSFFFLELLFVISVSIMSAVLCLFHSLLLLVICPCFNFFAYLFVRSSVSLFVAVCDPSSPWHSRGGKHRSCEPAFPPLQPLHPRGMPRGRGGRTPKKGGRNKDSS